MTAKRRKVTTFKLKSTKNTIKSNKYGAVRCESDGIKFPSKLERDYYIKLKALQKSGEVLFFLRQVGFDLIGGVRYFADFQVFYANGEVEFVDTKGVLTDISKLKIKQVEALYPIEIKLIRR